MCSRDALRESVQRRLAAAREEITGAFKKTIVHYEKEIGRQRRLLDLVWEPGIKLHNTGLPQQQSCKEEEVLTDQQLCNQEINSSIDQEDPEPPQVKEEQEGEQLVLKQATDCFMLTPTDEEKDHREAQTLLLKPDESAAQKESAVSASVVSHVVGSSNSDLLLTANIKKVKREKKIDFGPKFCFKRPKGKKPRICKTCGKQITFSIQLPILLRAHTGEKPCICKICVKGFKQNGQLSVLMRIHTDEKP